MLVQIVMLAVLLSGGVFGAAFFHRRFEEILPLQLMIMMAVLYIFGLLDYLRTGVSFIILVTAVLYAAAFVRVIRQKCWREFFGRMITPAFALKENVLKGNVLEENVLKGLCWRKTC